MDDTQAQPEQLPSAQNTEPLIALPPVLGATNADQLMAPASEATLQPQATSEGTPLAAVQAPISEPAVSQPILSPTDQLVATDESPSLETDTAPIEPELPPVGQSESLQALKYRKQIPDLFPETKAAEVAVEQPRHHEATWLVILKAAGVFVGTYAVVFLAFESPALWSRFHYSATHKAGTQTNSQIDLLPQLATKTISLSDLKQNPTSFLSGTDFAGFSLADLGDNQLLLPKINVKVPIIWDSAPDEKTMLANLQNGVVHYATTALPNAGTGKVFISGHSSYYFFDPGKYKTVFANLDRVTVGDQIAITYKDSVYIYQVTDKQIVKPDNVSVLNQTTEPTLSLMTCYPVGTSLNRLIVNAKLLNQVNKTEKPSAPASTDPASIFYYLPA